nr:unnamed protein product [Callosobruchus chinensis]
MYHFYNLCYSPKPFIHFLVFWNFILRVPKEYDEKIFDKVYVKRANNAILRYPQVQKFMNNEQVRNWLTCMKKVDARLEENAKYQISTYEDRQLYCVRKIVDEFTTKAIMGTAADYSKCYATAEICPPNPGGVAEG